MCTAATYRTKDHYFGRTLDYEMSFGESVTITPRKFPFHFRCQPTLEHHYAIIGIATIADSYPLYYDATNEHGLSMAGLNFPGNAVYRSAIDNMVNIAPFELIPWILAQCINVDEARKCLKVINLVNIQFNTDYPLSDLHWIIADSKSAITVESGDNGLQIYDNPVGVLTNNPPFPYHMYNLKNYLNLTNLEPENRFAPAINLVPYSRGMGAIGLPGDLSSASRFIKAAFTKLNSLSSNTETDSISQFFHILESVSQQNGCVKVGNSYEKTLYTSCCNTEKGIYYYTTYTNHQISAVHLHRESLEAANLISYPLLEEQQIKHQN